MDLAKEINQKYIKKTVLIQQTLGTYYVLITELGIKNCTVSSCLGHQHLRGMVLGGDGAGRGAI